MACRRAVRAPTFSLAVVTILALGVGATTTMVSILDVLLWRKTLAGQPGSGLFGTSNDEYFALGNV